MKDHEDAYGHEVYDCLAGKSVYEVVERDDGYIDAHYEDWPPSEQEAMSYVTGRVLRAATGPAAPSRSW